MFSLLTQTIRAGHRQALRHAFYPLALSSLLALLLVVGRVYLSGTRGYIFLVWNLILAWMPYLMSLWADVEFRREKSRWRLLLPAAVWLLFFPNAPYILTDFVHLQYHPVFYWWYDVGLIAAFAWAGCFLAVASLNAMQTIVEATLGRIAGWAFALAVAGLSGFGIYLGRVQRWNSWDALLAPHALLENLAATIANRSELKEAIGISGLFGALLLMLYLMYTIGAARRRDLQTASSAIQPGLHQQRRDLNRPARLR